MRDTVSRAGYLELADAPFEVDLRLSTARVAAPTVPDGYVVRSAQPSDDLLEVHRASRRPADLPFAPGHAPFFSPAATSFLTAEMLTDVEVAWPYRRDLHIVVEAPDRVLAASCIAWLDPTTGTAAIEPLGVRPEYRRRGLAGALCLRAAQLIHAAGGTEVVVHPRGDAGYPAPLGAYLRCGFRKVGRTWLYARS